MNFLGSLLGAKPPLSTPGFAGPLPGQQGMPGFDMPAVAPIDQQLNVAPAPAAAPRPRGGGLNNVLGTIGDVLLAMSGGQPMYGPQKQARERRTQMGAALQNYLGQSDPALAELAQTGAFDVADLVNFRKLTQPEQVEQPGGVREYQFAKSQGFNGSYMDFIKVRYPGMMAPVTLGPNDTIEQPGQPSAPQADDGPTATGPNGEKVRFNRGTGQWEPMGGAPGNAPAPTFL